MSGHNTNTFREQFNSKIMQYNRVVWKYWRDATRNEKSRLRSCHKKMTVGNYSSALLSKRRFRLKKFKYLLNAEIQFLNNKLQFQADSCNHLTEMKSLPSHALRVCLFETK